METLDCRLDKCPAPVVETRKLLLAHKDTPLQVLVGDEIARDNVIRLAENQGYKADASVTEGGYALQLTPLRKQGTEPASTPASKEKTVVYLGADTMGTGDDELGRTLLKNFIFTLLELDQPPDAVLFVNTAVKLVCSGSDVLEALEKLACNGTDIAACGLCLEYFSLKDHLRVGRITNMLEIVTSLGQAGRLIRP